MLTEFAFENDKVTLQIRLMSLSLYKSSLFLHTKRVALLWSLSTSIMIRGDCGAHILAKKVLVI